MKITTKEKLDFDLNTTSSSELMFKDAQGNHILWPTTGLHADYRAMCDTMHTHYKEIGKPVNVIKFLKEKLGAPKFQVKLSCLTAVWPEDHLVITGSTRGIDILFRNASSGVDLQQAWNELTLAITGKSGTWNVP